MTLVTHSLPVSILATCRFIHNEAMPHIAPQLAELRSLRQQRTTRLILDYSTLPFFGGLKTYEESLFSIITRKAERFRTRDPGPPFFQSPCVIQGRYFPKAHPAYQGIIGFIRKVAEHLSRDPNLIMVIKLLPADLERPILTFTMGHYLQIMGPCFASFQAADKSVEIFYRQGLPWGQQDVDFMKFHNLQKRWQDGGKYYFSPCYRGGEVMLKSDWEEERWEESRR